VEIAIKPSAYWPGRRRVFLRKLAGHPDLKNLAEDKRNCGGS
jgi:hypothetical protein